MSEIAPGLKPQNIHFDGVFGTTKQLAEKPENGARRG
jgi:hypothetical protein